MNLAALTTTTTVAFCQDRTHDDVSIDGTAAKGPAKERVVSHLSRIRRLTGKNVGKAHVVSSSNFPAGAGLASSASAFAALTVAACTASGLTLSTDELSRLARLGSGSACRSVPAGFVEWNASESEERSFGRTIASPEHWDLHDVIAIIEPAHKPTGSTEGHHAAHTSPFQAARVASIPARLERCKAALLARDWDALAPVIEEDALAMHAVMMTSTPSLFYWYPGTIAVMQAVRAWRTLGHGVAFTIDAGPNVHCICPHDAAAMIEDLVRSIPGVSCVITSGVGGPARIVS